jgi:hypothetical protein
VHVAEFLDSLGFGEDVEVMIASFPDKLFCAISGEALFDDLDYGGKLCGLWLGEKQVDVVRHQNVAVDFKVVFQTSFFDNLLESVAGCGSFEDVAMAVAADGNKVEVASSVSSFEALWHG